MPTRDAFHQIVRIALEKDGWIITHDPLQLRVGAFDLYIDLGAEQVIAAERQEQKIAVEVKSFISESPISEFHTALGQFINYRAALAELESPRVLYLAVPSRVYDSFFLQPFVQNRIEQNQLRLIVYDVSREEIVQWTE